MWNQSYGSYTSRSSSFVSAYRDSVQPVTAMISKWWAAATAAPIAFAAFWGTSTENKNDIESLLADAQECTWPEDSI